MLNCKFMDGGVSMPNENFQLWRMVCFGDKALYLVLYVFPIRLYIIAFHPHQRRIALLMKIYREKHINESSEVLKVIFTFLANGQLLCKMTIPIAFKFRFFLVRTIRLYYVIDVKFENRQRNQCDTMVS